MIEDIWYEYRTPEGIALIGTVFHVEYYCDQPYTEEQTIFSDKYIRPAIEEMARELEKNFLKQRSPK